MLVGGNSDVKIGGGGTNGSNIFYHKRFYEQM
jgi:hypothetical protein